MLLNEGDATLSQKGERASKVRDVDALNPKDVAVERQIASYGAMAGPRAVSKDGRSDPTNQRSCPIGALRRTTIIQEVADRVGNSIEETSKLTLEGRHPIGSGAPEGRGRRAGKVGGRSGRLSIHTRVGSDGRTIRTSAGRGDNDFTWRDRGRERQVGTLGSGPGASKSKMGSVKGALQGVRDGSHANHA